MQLVHQDKRSTIHLNGKFAGHGPRHEMTNRSKLDTLQLVELADGVEIRLRIAGPLLRAGAYLIDPLIRS